MIFYQTLQFVTIFHIKSTLKARVWNSKIPTGQQLSQYGKWDGLILSLLSYQFEFYWLLLDCKQKHMVAINIVCLKKHVVTV